MTGELSKRQRRELPCGHFAFAWRLEGSFEIASCSPGPAQKLVVKFSDETGELFGVTPRDAAVDSAYLQEVQAVIDGLLGTPENPRLSNVGHVLALVRYGSGAGGGDVDGGFFLEGTSAQWC